MEPEHTLNLSVRMGNYTEALLGVSGLRFMQNAINQEFAQMQAEGDFSTEVAFEMKAIVSDNSRMLFLVYINVDNNYMSITPINRTMTTEGALKNAKAYLN